MKLIDPNKRTAYKPATGRLLIAEPFLTDPSFARTVVFLCEHGDEGTIGFTLNRISLNIIGELLPDIAQPWVPVHEGGPVQPDTLHIIHAMPEELGGLEIIPGVYWGGSYENLARLAQQGKIDESRLRLLVGYAGWEKGQLEEELSQGSWIVAPASAEIIFEHNSNLLWQKALASLGKDFARMANLPLHPQFN
jgi:putative transcriptional regulator